MKTKYKYIHFEKSSLTDVEWEIVNNRKDTIIGYIEYYDPWHKYVFCGYPGFVFSVDCLADIIDFIKQLPPVEEIE